THSGFQARDTRHSSVTRYAIGDVQGCHDELKALLTKIRFSADRDQLWFTGDLVNRGPRSLDVLREVRAMADNAIVVLGNHDLHLLAVALGPARELKAADTMRDVLEAPDRDALLEWLIARPLAHFDAGKRDLLVHAGVVPQWTVDTTLALAREVEDALRSNPRELFGQMYGNDPDRWSDSLSGIPRLRFAINVLTRLRVCTADGRVDLTMKGPPEQASAPWLPWFEHAHRRTRDVRVIFGHWSALGLVRREGLLGLDTGCVWGGSLTACD